MSENMMEILKCGKRRVDHAFDELEDGLKSLGILEDDQGKPLQHQVETLKHHITETLKNKVYEVFDKGNQ